MPNLHNPQYKEEILRRLTSLRPDAERKWGKMSVAQMLWHVNEAMDAALGRSDLGVVKPPIPLPKPVLKFLVLNAPWGKGAPTLKRWIPQNDRYQFSAEHARCLRLVEEVAAKPLGSEWPDSPTLGRMSGDEVSRLQAKHLNHHLTQFGT